MAERLFIRFGDEAPPLPESTTPDGVMRAFLPSRSLSPYVVQLVSYKEEIPAGQEVLERVLPDGAARLIFNVGDAPAVGNVPGQPLEAVGACAEPAVVRLSACVEGVSLALRPGAASALLGVPASELTGRVVALDLLWKKDAQEVLERMALARGADARIAVLEEVLLRRLRRSQPTPEHTVLEAVRVITRSLGRNSVREVAAQVGVSERRLQQLFQAQVGLTPRTYSRLARLHGCLRVLRAARRPGWARLAQDGGFSDQSHLINEFRSLCGLTPTEFLKREVAGSSNT